MARISDEAAKLNIEVVKATPGADGKVYRVRDIFTTRDGTWEVNASTPGGLPQWARDTYLKAYGSPDYFDDAGGDHHMFGGIYDEAQRSMENDAVIHYWTWTDNANHVDMPVKAKSGWANVEMYNKYNPADTTKPQGAWAWKPKTDIPTDYVKGGGLAYGWHVSFFVTWVLSNESGGGGGTTDDLTERVTKLVTWAKAISAKYPQGPQYG